jgi:hypothetical protein
MISMKGQMLLDLPLKEIIGMIILLIAIVGLWLVLPKTVLEGSARANTFELARAIDKACFTGEEQVIENFVLPQHILGDTGGKIATFIPQMKISSVGDPNYVIYYEMFPPGEALSWEVYMRSMGHRGITYIDEGSTVPLENLKEFSEKNKEKYEIFIKGVLAEFKRQADEEGFDSSEIAEEISKKGYLDLSGIITANIILEKGLDVQAGEYIENPDPLSTIGDWGDQRTGGVTTPFFKFSNYVGAPIFNKSIVKYSACGDNSLCMKTTDGVLVFPLNNCKNIDYIMLDKNEGNTDEKYQDKSEFYLASPCKAERVKISMAQCNIPDDCRTRIDFPIYKYSKDLNELVREGDHTECINVGLNIDETLTNGNVLPESSAGNFNCIKVELEGKQTHCDTEFRTDSVWRNAWDTRNLGVFGGIVGGIGGAILGGKLGALAGALGCGFLTVGTGGLGAAACITAFVMAGATVGGTLGGTGGAIAVPYTKGQIQYSLGLSKETPMQNMVMYLDENYYLLKPNYILPISKIDFLSLVDDSWLWP